MTRTAPDWARGMRALATLAVAPATLKGMTVRAWPGPARQAFENALSVMLDEGADADECAPLTLRERLPFSVDLSEVKAGEAIARLPAPADLDAARDRVATVTTDPDHERQLVLLADRLGIESLRAPLLALDTARALAALDGEDRPKGPALIIHPSDIRLQRFEDRSDRLVIFAVDASGSAAMARMAEAKGAVELLFAQAYAKRDPVALIAFRGQTSDVLLSPTRSLVQAKRPLAGLPGGGGTPLASGLWNAFELAHHGRRRGFCPSVAFLTDGRANIALDGTPGREPARRDARIVARHLHLLGFPPVVIDTAARPGDEGIALAGWLAADYLALPRADAGRICAATEKALNG